MSGFPLDKPYFFLPCKGVGNVDRIAPLPSVFSVYTTKVDALGTQDEKNLFLFTNHSAMASFIENTVTGYKKDGTRYIKGTYVEFVEAYREKGKKYPRRRVLWRKNKDDLEKLGWFDRMLLWFAARTNQSKVVNLTETFVKEVVQWGLPEAIRNLLEEAGILERIRQLDKKGRHTYRIEDIVVGYVTMSFLEKCSKLRYYDRGQDKVFGYKPNQLHQIYRAVRKLAPVSWLTLEEMASAGGLLKPSVELLLADFTTVYWESELSDGFRERGWSKDGKPDNVQVLVALVIDERGFPLAMHVFKGNCSEKKAIREFIEWLEEKVDIREVVFVGDAGLYSKAFLEQIRGKGWKVLLRMPRNALTDREKEEVLREEGWRVLETDTTSGEVLKELKEMRLGEGYRLIAVKDHRMRRKQLRELEEMLAELGLEEEDGRLRTEGLDIQRVKERVAQRAGRAMKGIVQIKGGEIRVDERRIEELRQWSGVSLLLTDVSWSAERVVRKYSFLRRIEAKWRDFKSGLHVRPVYHRKEEAIRGHFVLKFFALQVATLMEQKLELAGLGISWRKAVDLLRDIQAVKVSFADGTVSWVRTEAASREALRVMEVLGVPTDRVVLSRH